MNALLLGCKEALYSQRRALLNTYIGLFRENVGFLTVYIELFLVNVRLF